MARSRWLNNASSASVGNHHAIGRKATLLETQRPPDPDRISPVGQRTSLRHHLEMAVVPTTTPARPFEGRSSTVGAVIDFRGSDGPCRRERPGHRKIPGGITGVVHPRSTSTRPAHPRYRSRDRRDFLFTWPGTVAHRFHYTIASFGEFLRTALRSNAGCPRMGVGHRRLVHDHFTAVQRHLPRAPNAFWPDRRAVIAAVH